MSVLNNHRIFFDLTLSKFCSQILFNSLFLQKTFHVHSVFRRSHYYFLNLGSVGLTGVFCVSKWEFHLFFLCNSTIWGVFSYKDILLFAKNTFDAKSTSYFEWELLKLIISKNISKNIFYCILSMFESICDRVMLYHFVNDKLFCFFFLRWFGSNFVELSIFPLSWSSKLPFLELFFAKKSW